MFKELFKILRVKSTKKGYEDTKGNGLLSTRSQSEEQPEPEFGGTQLTSDHAFSFRKRFHTWDRT